MNNTLKKINITKAGPHISTKIDINKHLTVILANNGTGKTIFSSLLKGKNSRLRGITKDSLLELKFDEVSKPKTKTVKWAEADEFRDSDSEFLKENFIVYDDVIFNENYDKHYNGEQMLNLDNDTYMVQRIENNLRRIEMNKEIIAKSRIFNIDQFNSFLESTITSDRDKFYMKKYHMILKHERITNKNEELSNKYVKTWFKGLVEKTSVRPGIRHVGADYDDFIEYLYSVCEANRIDEKSGVSKVQSNLINFIVQEETDPQQFLLNNLFIFMLLEKRILRMMNGLRHRISYARRGHGFIPTEIEIKKNEERLATYKRRVSTKTKEIAEISEELSKKISNSYLSRKITITNELQIKNSDSNIVLATGEFKLLHLMTFLIQNKGNGKTIILDDPLTSIDNSFSRFIVNFIKEEMTTNQIIFLTHNEHVLNQIIRTYKNQLSKSGPEKSISINYWRQNDKFNVSSSNFNPRENFLMTHMARFRDEKLRANDRLFSARKIFEYLSMLTNGHNQYTVMIDGGFFNFLNHKIKISKQTSKSLAESGHFVIESIKEPVLYESEIQQTIKEIESIFDEVKFNPKPQSNITNSNSKEI